MNFLQNKPVLISIAVVMTLSVVGGIVFLVVTAPKKSSDKKSADVSQETSLKGLEERHTVLRQTLEQEKADRAEVKATIEASNNYQRLAQ